MVNTDLNSGIREMNVEGTIRFSIKTFDTEENEAIHSGFKEFCKIECDNNYTLGLKRLLEHYEHQNHIEALWSSIAELDAKIENNKPKEEEEKKEGVF